MSSAIQREPPGISIVHHGRRVLLKWHMLRRRPRDPPFAMANLSVGLTAGASLEIDIRRLADDLWVCLHDDDLAGETDGAGPVSLADSAAIRRLRVIGSDGPPPLLTDVADQVGTTGFSSASLQLDLKEPLAGITDRAVSRFADAVGPIARMCVLSGTDWSAVRRLGSAIPRLRLGWDPLDLLAARASDLVGGEAVAPFIDEMLTVAGEAAWFYLHHGFVTTALSHGVNPVARLKANGANVDVWTLDPDTPDIATVMGVVLTAGADQITTNDPLGLAELWIGAAENGFLQGS
jgi:glycerophosphoryl diester phosphodiesterase